MNLRRVEDSSPPMTMSELQSWGNRKATEIRPAAITAVRRSMSQPRFLERGISLTPAMLRLWCDDAKRAREAWAQVEALTTELIYEVEKTRGR